MDQKTIYMDYLAHHGVKGMRWGVRKKQEYFNKNGTLSKKGYEKYYTNGKLNKAGHRARNNAITSKDVGKHPARAVGIAAAGGAFAYAVSGRHAVKNMHGFGNLTITAMKHAGKGLGSRRIVAGMFIAGMGAILASEIYPTVKNAYVATRYNKDKQYKKRIDSTADLRFTENNQRNKKRK